MRGSFSIGKIAGIEIGIHYSWILAFVLFAWVFAEGTFQPLFPNSPVSYWVAGVIISVAIFVSVLIHELCHSLVAMSRGLKVRSIVFFIFGGVSNIEKEPETAGVEFIMALAGPLSSLVLGGVFLGISYALYLPGNIFRAVAHVTPTVAIVYYIGWINVVLGVFNIIPGFPLDGGRVFRAIIWGATRSLHAATVVAGNVGRAFGWAMIIFGIINLFQIKIGIFQGYFIDGIWFIFIGWFLTSAADAAMREESLQRALTGVKVKDVMETNPECVSPSTPVDRIIHESFIQRGRRALPICDQSGLLGIVTLADVKKVPQDRWAGTTAVEVMTRTPLQSINQDDDLNNALRALAQDDLNQVPVMGDGKMVGLLSRADVMRYLHTRQQLGIKPGPDRG